MPKLVRKNNASSMIFYVHDGTDFTRSTCLVGWESPPNVNWLVGPFKSCCSVAAAAGLSRSELSSPTGGHGKDRSWLQWQSPRRSAKSLAMGPMVPMGTRCEHQKIAETWMSITCFFLMEMICCWIHPDSMVFHIWRPAPHHPIATSPIRAAWRVPRGQMMRNAGPEVVGG